MANEKYEQEIRALRGELQNCVEKMRKEKDRPVLEASSTSDTLLRAKQKHIDEQKASYEAVLERRDQVIEGTRNEIASLTDS